MPLPPGYTLDTAPKLPPGYTLDAPQGEPSTMEKLSSAVQTANQIPIDALTGAVKGAGSTLFHLGKIASSAPLVGPAAQDAADRLAQLLGLGSAHSQENFATEPAGLKTQGTAQAVGKGAEQVGEFFLPGATPEIKALEKTGMIGKMVAGAATGAGVSAAQGSNPLVGGVAGAVAPGVQAIASKVAPRIVNAAIGAKVGDFATGANPGAGVVDEGIVAPTMAAMKKKIGAAQDAVGTRIGQALKSPAAQKISLQLRDVIEKPINDAIDGLETVGNDAGIVALNKMRAGIEQRFAKAGGSIDSARLDQAFEVKKALDLSIKHGSAAGTDVNASTVIKQIRRNIADAISGSYPPIKALNDRFANLAEAWDAVAGKINEVAKTSPVERLLSLKNLILPGAAATVAHNPMVGVGVAAGQWGLKTAPGATGTAQALRGIGAAPAELAPAAASLATQDEQ